MNIPEVIRYHLALPLIIKHPLPPIFARQNLRGVSSVCHVSCDRVDLYSVTKAQGPGYILTLRKALHNGLFDLHKRAPDEAESEVAHSAAAHHASRTSAQPTTAKLAAEVTNLAETWYGDCTPVIRLSPFDITVVLAALRSCIIVLFIASWLDVPDRPFQLM